jgi:hypothetical protein
MSYTVELLLYRKPGITQVEFVDYYENMHLPLLHAVYVGDDFPSTYDLYYLPRENSPLPLTSDEAGSKKPASSLTDTASYQAKKEARDYDCILTLGFATARQFHVWASAYNESNRMMLEMDESRFLDRERTVARLVEDSLFVDDLKEERVLDLPVGPAANVNEEQIVDAGEEQIMDVKKEHTADLDEEPTMELVGDRQNELDGEQAK